MFLLYRKGTQDLIKGGLCGDQVINNLITIGAELNVNLCGRSRDFSY